MFAGKQEQPDRFHWPEPLVIEIAAEHYQSIADPEARKALARLQAAGLRELCGGRSRQATSLRLELIAASAACGIAAERIACADLAVLVELTRVATARFRTSPRLQAEVCSRLETVLRELQAPPKAPARSRTWAAPSRARTMQPAAAIG